MIFLSLFIVGAGVLLFFYLQRKRERSLQELRNKTTLLENLKKNLDLLREELEQINTIVSTMVEQVIAVNHLGTVLYLNQAAEALLKVKSKEATGKHFVEIIRQASLNELLKAVLEEKEERFMEIELNLPKNHHFEVRAVPLQVNNQSGALLVLHDITRIQHLETIRKDFIANVSHELRTPLTTIRGYAETLLSGALADNKHNREFLQMVLTESERLSRLVDDLLDLSAIESGKDSPKKMFFSLEKLIKEVIEIVTPTAKELGVTFTTFFVQDLPDIHADRDQIKQVLLNLIDNAVKFNHKEGVVTIEATAKEGSHIVSIKDTGVGIPEIDIPRIFERFYRADKDRSRKFGGTGLGLAIVKHIINLHNGSIQVTSTPNQSSTFTLSLPQ